MRLDHLVAGCKVSIPIVVLGEDLEEEHWVGDVDEGIINAQGIAEEGVPTLPGFILHTGAQRNNASIVGCLAQAEIRTDFITGSKWHKCQVVFVDRWYQNEQAIVSPTISTAMSKVSSAMALMGRAEDVEECGVIKAVMTLVESLLDTEKLGGAFGWEPLHYQ